MDLTYQTEFLDYPRYADEADDRYDKLVSETGGKGRGLLIILPFGRFHRLPSHS